MSISSFAYEQKRVTTTASEESAVSPPITLSERSSTSLALLRILVDYLWVLGGIFGLIFGALQGGKLITTGRALLTGVALGILWWLLLEVVLANITNHASSPFSMNFANFLSSFPLAVLFGVLIGAIFIQQQEHHGSRQPS